jgi:hypothetical protein
MSENILQSFTLAPTQLVYHIIQKKTEKTKYFQLINVKGMHFFMHPHYLAISPLRNL